MTSWWDRFPGRLEHELEDFATRELKFEVDETLFRGASRLLLRGHIEHKGKPVALEIIYPDLFPYFRPEVYAPQLRLGRHQNPLLGNLCLLDRPSTAWKPHETGAWLIAERVPLLLSLLEAGPEAIRTGEAPQGEPVSVYFQGPPGTTIIVPEAALALDDQLRVGSGKLRFGLDMPPQLSIRALLYELTVRTHGQKTKIIAQAEEPLQRRFGGEEAHLRWVRLDGPPPGFDAEAIFAAAEAVQPGFGQPPWQRGADGEFAITGVVFGEEVRQGVIEDGWLFAVRWQRTVGKMLNQGSYALRGERLTTKDWHANPEARAAARGDDRAGRAWRAGRPAGARACPQPGRQAAPARVRPRRRVPDRALAVRRGRDRAVEARRDRPLHPSQLPVHERRALPAPARPVS